MAEALLVSRKDVVKFTAMNGNVDTDKFIQYVKHDNTIIKIRNYDNISNIYDCYNKYLESFSIDDVTSLLLTYKLYNDLYKPLMY